MATDPAIRFSDVQGLMDFAANLANLRKMVETGRALADVVLDGAADTQAAKTIAARLREQWAEHAENMKKLEA